MIFTDKNFKQEVLESDIPVLVDFWASWCPPCKMTEPIIEKLAHEFKATIKIGKLNVDQNKATASEYDIGGVPTFITFIDGRQIERRACAQSENMLRDMLKKFLD